MITYLKNWMGSVELNGTLYNSINDIPTLNTGEEFQIHLIPKQKIQPTEKSGEVLITVKQYMTKPATVDFDFMERWNNNVPMPLRTMVGERVKETRGMVYMKLHGDIVSDRVTYCMKCGRPLTNPVSQYFGIGPECGNHNYVNPFNSETELKEAVEKYRKTLQNITWEGWVIKSAIIEEEAI